MTKNSIERLIAFFPWLTLSAPAYVAGIRFVPFRIIDSPARSAVSIGGVEFPSAAPSEVVSLRISPELLQLETSLDKILASYVDITGVSITNCTLACIESNQPIWDLQGKDREQIRFAALLLTLVVMSCNEYFLTLGKYANTTRFQLYWQSFVEPAEHLAFGLRRRDGSALDGGYKHGEVTFTVPLQCRPIDQVCVDQGLSEGINKALEADSGLISRLKTALSFFNLANTDSESILDEAEIILMGSTFEQMLKAEGAYQLSCKFGKLFRDYGSVRVQEAMKERPKIQIKEHYQNKLDLDGKRFETKEEYVRAQEESFVHTKWIEEFHDLRSKVVHGEKLSQRGWGWNKSEHLLIGAFAFPLLIKVMLSEEHYYSLTDEDKIRCKSLDRLLSKTEWHKSSSPRFNSTVWQETISEVSRRHNIQKAVDSFNRSRVGSTQAETDD